MISVALFRKGPRPRRAPRALPALEALESRTVPYSASGNLWPQPQLITISFVPDGTNLGGQSSNLFSTFDNDFGSASAWENVILKAAQTWAQQANINFTVVSDSGADSGSGSYQQGDPTFGDIRIGGFDFGDSSVLALGYMPPPVNNYSIAGDIAFNTAQVFNINGLDYDLYTVALHEFGHALGLDHSTSTAAIMYPDYQGVEYGLYSDDVAGIQSIYGARTPDAYYPDNSFSAAANITSTIDPIALTSALSGLSINTTTQKDYYTFTAPSGGSGSLALTVQSTGLSLLAPSVKVYDASQHQLASATGSGDLGSTLSLNVSVTAGQTYYIRVGAANTTAFGTGVYGMTLNFGTGASPTLPLPNTQTANGSPLSGGGGLADHTGSSEDYDLLTIGDDRFALRMTGNVAPLPHQASASTIQPSVPTIPLAALAVLAPAPRGPVVSPDGETAAPIAPVGAVETATRAAPLTGGEAWPAGASALPSAAGIVPVSDDDAEEPPPELPAPTAAPEAISVEGSGAVFGASGWRDDTAAPVLSPHGTGLADQPAESAALAAGFALALAPIWLSRFGAADDSRRRPLVAR